MSVWTIILYAAFLVVVSVVSYTFGNRDGFENGFGACTQTVELLFENADKIEVKLVETDDDDEEEE